MFQLLYHNLYIRYNKKCWWRLQISSWNIAKISESVSIMQGHIVFTFHVLLLPTLIKQAKHSVSMLQ